MQSGAGAGSSAAVEALRGLISIIALTLSDDATAALRAGAAQGSRESSSASLAAVDSASQALAVLEGFGRRAAEHEGGGSPKAAPDAPDPLPQVAPL